MRRDLSVLVVAVVLLPALLPGRVPARRVAITIDDGPVVGEPADLGNFQRVTNGLIGSFQAEKVPVTIFLMNGVKLQGVITWFDNFCVLLRRDGQSQLVYKHAISTVMPSQPITLYEAEDH